MVAVARSLLPAPDAMGEWHAGTHSLYPDAAFDVVFCQNELVTDWEFPLMLILWSRGSHPLRRSWHIS